MKVSDLISFALRWVLRTNWSPSSTVQFLAYPRGKPKTSPRLRSECVNITLSFHSFIEFAGNIDKLAWNCLVNNTVLTRTVRAENSTDSQAVLTKQHWHRQYWLRRFGQTVLELVFACPHGYRNFHRQQDWPASLWQRHLSVWPVKHPWLALMHKTFLDSTCADVFIKIARGFVDSFQSRFLSWPWQKTDKYLTCLSDTARLYEQWMTSWITSFSLQYSP